MNTHNAQTWFFPYARPTATTTVLDESEYFNESMSPLFNNIRHPYNPQYKYENVNSAANHNMMQGQPQYQHDNFYSDHTNKHQSNVKKLGLLAGSKSKEANIHWNNNGVMSNTKFDFNPYQINPEFRALPDGLKQYDNPNKMTGPLTEIIPWDQFPLEKTDDEYFNERNFQRIYNHPFYDNMKPFLEQPFKKL